MSLKQTCIVDTYNTPGTFTWKKRPGAVKVKVYMVGAGGGGVSGTCAANAAAGSNNATGGIGGGVTIADFDASILGATESVSVPSGGAGGPGRNTAGFGNAGPIPDNCVFGSWAFAESGYTAGSGLGSFNNNSTGGNGLNGGRSTSNVLGVKCGPGGAGGSDGGNIFSSAPVNGSVGGFVGNNFTNTDNNAQVGYWGLIAGGLAGVAGNPGTDGGPGNDFGPNGPYGGSGGGGGGASILGAGGKGGKGGYPGGGGGGGGSSVFPAFSGNGGDGANGLVIVTTYF